MCAPMALAAASFAVQGASAVSGYAGQQANYKQEKRLYEENVRNAQIATANQYSFDQLHMQQERNATLQQTTQGRIDALRAKSTATVAAGEAGVLGLSVDHLMRDYSAREGRYDASAAENLDMNRTFMIGEMEAHRATGQNQINSMKMPQKPSFLDAGLRIAGAAVDAGSSYLKLSAR